MYRCLHNDNFNKSYSYEGCVALKGSGIPCCDYNFSHSNGEKNFHRIVFKAKGDEDYRCYSHFFYYNPELNIIVMVNGDELKKIN